MGQKEKIRKLAYWLYLLKGKRSGNDLEDWLKAERTVAKLDEFVKKCYKYTSIFVFILIVLIAATLIVLAYSGYQITIEKVM